MSNPKVSVIVPVYNVESYLQESLDSIINQTLKEIEIICVDDASTDNSLAILKKYAKKDKRIIVLEQENQGAGVARNTGLDIARGKYLSFLDPDDFFELSLLEDCYNKAIETDVDIVVYGSNSYDDNTSLFSDQIAGSQNGIRYVNLPENHIFSHIDMQDKIFNTFLFVPWNKFFKTDFIKENSIRYQPVFRSNDIYFTCISLIIAKKIIVLDKVLTYYRKGMKSNSQSTTDKYPLNFYETFVCLYQKLHQLNVIESVFESFYIVLFQSIKYATNQKKTYDGFKLLYEKIKTNLHEDFDITNIECFIYLQNSYTIQCYEDYKLMLEYSVDEYLQLKEKYFIDENDTSLKVSVIIPVYNVEKYLRACLESVVNQTLENIEIICINDGSSDRSIDILREYAGKDDRFVIINQQNQGQSVARNKGINLAKGKYIYFLDSDDMIVPYALERMFEEAVTNNLDVLYFDGKATFETSDLEKEFNSYNNSYQSKFSTNLVLSGAKMFAKMSSSSSYRVQCCLYFMKTEFVQREGIIFPEGIIHQDNVYMFKTILVADRVKHIKEKLFIQYVRSNSTITQGITFNHFYGYLVCYMEMLEYSNLFEYTSDVGEAVFGTLNSIVNGAVREYSVLSQAEKDEVENLTRSQRHYFDTVIMPKVQLKYYTNNSNKQGNNDNQTNACFPNQNGPSSGRNSQHCWEQEELAKVRAERLEYKKELARIKGIEKSVSFKVGRIITWLPRKFRDFFKKR